MELFGILKKLIEKQKEKGTKTNIKQLLVILMIGIIVIIFSSSLFKSGQQKSIIELPTQLDNDNVAAVATTFSKGYYKASEIENILSKIYGAGKVEIIATYSESTELVPALDRKTSQSITNEKDNTGGTRSLSQENLESNIIFEDTGKTKKPYIIKELLPKVKGVVIVADGADNFEVKENLTRAAQSLFDVPLHKIQVFKRK